MIERVSLAEANAVLTRGKPPHYLGSVTFRPQFSLAQFDDDMALNIVALAVFASPVAAHFTRSLTKPLELTRLWQADSERAAPKVIDHRGRSHVAKPLSAFLAASLRWIKQEVPLCDCVFAYSDPAVRDARGRVTRTGKLYRRRHSGGVYVATGFTYLGPGRADNVSDHWLDPAGRKVSATAAYRLLKTRGRKRIAELRPDWKLIEAEPRLLYCYGMALTVAQVLDRIGAGHYQQIKKAPSPLD